MNNVFIKGLQRADREKLGLSSKDIRFYFMITDELSGKSVIVERSMFGWNYADTQISEEISAEAKRMINYNELQDAPLPPGDRWLIRAWAVCLAYFLDGFDALGGRFMIQAKRAVALEIMRMENIALYVTKADGEEVLWT